MRKIIKLSVSLLLAFFIGLSLAGPVFAQDSSVTFKDGKVIVFAPGSVDADTSLFDNFEGIMPGDLRFEEITVSNESSEFDYIKVYLRAVPLDETSQIVDAAKKAGETVASMKDFLSQLSMKVYKGTETIYDASPDQVDGLADNVYLGTLRKGESVVLNVELEVPIELGNDYADRVGEVKWTFVIEGFNEKDDPKPTETKTEEPTTIPDKTKTSDPTTISPSQTKPDSATISRTPKTGEQMNYILPILLLSAAGVLLIFSQSIRRKI